MNKADEKCASKTFVSLFRVFLQRFLREQMKIGTGKMSEYPDDTYKDTLVS